MTTDRLYGLPDAEYMADDPATVFEEHIEPWLHDDHDQPREWIIEEWTVADPITHLDTAANIIERITDWVYDNGEYDDDGRGTLDGLDKDPDVVAAAENLRRVYASKMTYRMAGEKVAEHKLTIDADGRPRLDERLLYRPAGDPGPVVVSTVIPEEDDPAPDIGPDPVVVPGEPRLCRTCGARHRSNDDNTLCDAFDPDDRPQALIDLLDHLQASVEQAKEARR